MDVHRKDSSWEQGLNHVERLCQDPPQSRVAMRRVGVRSVVRDVEKDRPRGVLRVEPVRTAETTAAGSERRVLFELLAQELRHLDGVRIDLIEDPGGGRVVRGIEHRSHLRRQHPAVRSCIRADHRRLGGHERGTRSTRGARRSHDACVVETVSHPLLPQCSSLDERHPVQPFDASSGWRDGRRMSTFFFDKTGDVIAGHAVLSFLAQLDGIKWS